MDPLWVQIIVLSHWLLQGCYLSDPEVHTVKMKYPDGKLPRKQLSQQPWHLGQCDMWVNIKKSLYFPFFLFFELFIQHWAKKFQWWIMRIFKILERNFDLYSSLNSYHLHTRSRKSWDTTTPFWVVIPFEKIKKCGSLG